jgi:hypothetical protein
MLIVRGDAQSLPSELNTAATGEVWFDPIFPKTDGMAVGTVVFSPNARTVWHQHEHGHCSRSRPATDSSAAPNERGRWDQRVRSSEEGLGDAHLTRTALRFRDNSRRRLGPTPAESRVT